MDIFKLLGEEIEQRLLNDLRKDFPNLSDNEINEYIFNRTKNPNMDFNKPYIPHKNRFKCPVEIILDNIYPIDKRSNVWKRKLLNRYCNGS